MAVTKDFKTQKITYQERRNCAALFFHSFSFIRTTLTKLRSLFIFLSTQPLFTGACQSRLLFSLRDVCSSPVDHNSVPGEVKIISFWIWRCKTPTVYFQKVFKVLLDKPSFVQRHLKKLFKALRAFCTFQILYAIYFRSPGTSDKWLPGG